MFFSVFLTIVAFATGYFEERVVGLGEGFVGGNAQLEESGRGGG